LAGKKSWYFPDAELPPKGSDPEVFGHESVIILNTNKKDAHIDITIYWTDRDPEKCDRITVGAGRVFCIRAVDGEKFAGIAIPEGVQYAISLESDVPIVAQYGRLDVRQNNMAFYTTPGYAE